jgi:hypothetical protein
MSYGAIKAGIIGALLLWSAGTLQAQDGELTVSVDVTSAAVPLPSLLRANVDLGGRGVSSGKEWPQSLAGKETIDRWQKEVGTGRLYRLQYNLWEIFQPAQAPVRGKKKVLESPAGLEETYAGVIKSVSDAGGTVLVNLFGTPTGTGRIRDKKSPPADPRQYKALVKRVIRKLSCERKLRVWYQVWSAPDLDDFFLGRRQEYLLMYRMAAEAVQELEAETGMHIPIGGPGSSWWFQNFDGNTVAVPERSLVYQLIWYCYRYHLPLDFISWHAYSSDPQAELAQTMYRKTSVGLIRDWLRYFRMDTRIPLIVEEWNYDCGANNSPGRGEKAQVAASYIPARLSFMHKAGIDQAVYFALEDFQAPDEGVVRNVGLFRFSPDVTKPPVPKAGYAVMRMLERLKPLLYPASLQAEDEFVRVLVTKGEDSYAALISNYIDPDIVNNYVTRAIGAFSEKERHQMLTLIRTKRFNEVLEERVPLAKIAASGRVKETLKKAIALRKSSASALASPRTVRLELKKLSAGSYEVERVTVDSRCAGTCETPAAETKTIEVAQGWTETVSVEPYSVELLLFKKLPPAPVAAPAVAEPAAEKPAEAPRADAPAAENVTETNAPDETR